jgi:hypothetical protein
VGATCQTPRAAPGPLGSAPLPCGCHMLRSSRALKALSGPRTGVPTAPSCPSWPPPDGLTPPARRLTPHAAAPIARVPTAAVRSRVTRTTAVLPWPPRRSPVAVVLRRHPRAGEPPVSSAVSHAPVPCRRWLAVQRRARCAGQGHVGRAPHGRGPCAPRGRGSRPRCATRPSVVSAQWQPI